MQDSCRQDSEKTGLVSNKKTTSYYKNEMVSELAKNYYKYQESSESDGKSKEIDDQPKKKVRKKPNQGDVEQVIIKSRNAKAKIRKEKKTKVFAD